MCVLPPDAPFSFFLCSHTHNRTHRNYEVITRERVCTHPKCQRRFQGDGAFVRYPNGNAVHYSCWTTSKNVDLSTMETFEETEK